MLSSKRKMVVPLVSLMATTAAIPYFLLLLISINTSPASATIKGPPTAERKELKRIVRLGDNVRLMCPMTGHPNPIIDWTKDNEQINNYAWNRFKPTKKNLKIAKVMLEDTGIYICKGTNGFGSEEIRIDLIVIDPNNFPDLGEGEVPDVAPPVLTQETKSLRSAYRKNSGDNFKLSCEALGKPDPEIVWYKNEIEISTHGVGSIGSSSSGSAGKAILTIKNLQPSNAGIYTCQARNSEGTVSRKFTLDIVPSPEEIPDSRRNTGGSVVYQLEHAGEKGFINAQVPDNTTVEQGNPAVLECRVHSTIQSKIMWLKRLEKSEEHKYKNNEVIVVGKEKFKIIQKNKQSEDVRKVNANGVEYLNKMVIRESSLQDAGMYICFVKNPSAYKFKSAYLTVIPKSNLRDSGSGSNESLESKPILILIICLAIVVLVLIVTIVTCFVKKRQKKALHSSNTSSASGSDNSPELTENLMRQQQLHHQPHHHNSQYNQQAAAHQQAMQRNLQMQHQQQSMYQQPYHQQQQQQHLYQQQQHLQQPTLTNNNHRNTTNGQMNIMVNKMAETSLPPAPPPPPPSLHNEWHPNNLYSGGGSVATDSIVDAAGVPVVNMYSTNIHHHLQQHQQQQNQYEVPHAHTRYVPGGPASNEKSGSIFDQSGSQRHIYNHRNHY